MSTHNPYIVSLRAIWSRLLWDCRKSAHISRRRLAKLRDKHLEQKAVILCNGPSLNKVDFKKLEHVSTIALNKFNLKETDGFFTPDFLVAVNDLVIKQNKEFFESTDIPVFLSHRAISVVKAEKHITFLHSSGLDGFAEDCSMSISEGFTVTYVALQLAFHLGFSKVALVGCDHSYIFSGKPNEKTIISGDDLNHFDKNYFGNGLEWHNPDLLESERSYLIAKKKFSEAGRILVNCTEGGELDVLPRTQLDDFLEI